MKRFILVALILFIAGMATRVLINFTYEAPVYKSEFNQLIYANDPSVDYDHGSQTQSTIFIHSDLDPTFDNTQWVALREDENGDIIYFTEEFETVPINKLELIKHILGLYYQY